MFSRIRVALGIALLLSLITSIPVFAKGGFSFITISGPTLKEEVRATDAALTADFFAFADFYRDKATAPTNPGVGYEIARAYIDGNREFVFDRLHYYRETGYVFYDGIENGSSEYDGEWYIARNEVKAPFESALASQPAQVVPLQEKQPIPSQADNPIFQPQPVDPSARSWSGMIIAVATGLTTLFVFAFWRRKPSAQ